jgi:phenylacetate-CoA ligase
LWGDISETIVPLFPEEKLISILKQIKPDVLLTFPSVLLSLSRYDLSGINPRLIFTQGEMVTSHIREVVKKKFNLDLFETYGSVEFGSMAFECNEHFALHIITDNVYIELLDENGESVSSGERGEIVVTGLHKYVMPLIRYRIGDLGVLTDDRCPCGRSWPLLKSIEGRSNDLVVLPSGRKISWLYLQRCFYDPVFLENPFCISQYQLVQERVNRIIFKVVKGSSFSPELLERIKNNIEYYFAKQGEMLEVIIKLVEEIPMERTGKRRVFISKVV